MPIRLPWRVSTTMPSLMPSELPAVDGDQVLHVARVLREDVRLDKGVVRLRDADVLELTQGVELGLRRLQARVCRGQPLDLVAERLVLVREVDRRPSRC